MSKQMARFASIAAAAVVLGACSVMPGGGRVWVPQGPGGPTASEAKADAPATRAAPQGAPATAAAQTPAPQPQASRRYEIDPALIAQTPPAPAPARREATPPAAASTQLGGYTQATRYGDLLFVSGQISMDMRTNEFRGTTIEEQTRQVMENIRTILESHRLTMANVVSVTVFMKDLAQFRGMDAAYEPFFRSALPARSVVQVARLPRDALVEISVIAGR